MKKGITLVSCFCFMICACFNSSLNVNAEEISLIGHRGYSSKYVENTIESTLGAYEKGFDGVEIDIYESLDGTLWVFHDKSLKRMTGKKGSIFNLTKKNRKDYLLRNGETIPTLDEILSKLKGKKNIYIHVKGNGKKSFLSSAAQKKIVKSLKTYDLTSNTIIFAGATNMKKMNFGSVKTGWITHKEKYSELKSYMSSMKSKGVKYLVLLNYSQFRPKSTGVKIVKYAHRKNIKVGLYSTKKKGQYKYLSSIHADFAFSDYYLR